MLIVPPTPPPQQIFLPLNPILLGLDSMSPQGFDPYYIHFVNNSGIANISIDPKYDPSQEMPVCLPLERIIGSLLPH